MKTEELAELSDQELQQKLKDIKKSKIINAFIIGITIGIYTYSCVKNGFGLTAFFPLVIAYLIVRNSKNNEVLEKQMQSELKSRSL